METKNVILPKFVDYDVSPGNRMSIFQNNYTFVANLIENQF